MSDPIRILFVEDDFVDQTLVKRSLARCSARFELEVAESLQEAKGVLGERHFDCALVDLYLRDGEGIELLPFLSQTPMIMLTGLSDEGFARLALQRGIQDYLFKDTLDAQNLQRAILFAIERRKLDLMRVKLQETNRLAELGLLAASIAHEINNPNSFISGNLTFMRENVQATEHFLGELGAFGASLEPAQAQLLKGLIAAHGVPAQLSEMHELVDESLEGIARVSDIVRQMQIYSRVNSGEEPVERISLNDVAKWACTLTQTKIKQKAELFREFDPYLPLISAKQGKLAQIAANLLNNAIQAIPDDSRENHVKITTMRHGAHVCLQVEDTGCGVPEELKARVFEPFFSTKSTGRGTGLGLSISSELAKEHGGTLLIQDREGGGTVVTLKLPLVTSYDDAQGPVAPPPKALLPKRESTERFALLQRSRTPQAPHAFLASEKTNPTPPPPRFKVLVVDDEPAIRRAQARILKDFEVVQKAPEEALEVLTASADFDAIVCDMLMPGVDGVDVYRRLETHAPHLCGRIIFLTGGVFTERAERFIEQRQVRTLFKPVEPNLLILMLHEVIGQTSECWPCEETEASQHCGS